MVEADQAVVGGGPRSIKTDVSIFGLNERINRLKIMLGSTLHIWLVVVGWGHNSLKIDINSFYLNFFYP